MIFRRRNEGDDRASIPVATPVQAAQPFWPYFGSAPVPNVTNDNALGVPALWRGVNMIANAVGTSSPCRVYQGDEEVPAPLVITQPSPEMGTFDFYHATVAQILITGNALFIPLDYVDGFPQQLLPVPDASYSARYNDAGKVVYRIGDQELPASAVLHIRGFTRTGDPMGVGVVTAFRKALGHQLIAQDAASNAAIPSGIIKIDTKDLTKEQADLTKAQWLEIFSSATAGRTPAVLPASMSFEPISFSAEDSQWIEGRHFDVAQAAFMLNLDPSDLGASVGNSMTYANIESRAVDRLVNTYGPIGRRVEEALTTLLPAGQVARLSWERVLRTDSLSRAEFLAKMIAAGIYSVEYCQALERVPAQYRTQQVAA